MIKGTYKSISSESNSYNLLGQVVWFFLFVISISIETGLVSTEIYYAHEGTYWCLGLIAYAVGFYSPAKKIADSDSRVGVPLFIAVAWLVQICVSITVYCFRELEFSQFNHFTPDHLVHFVTSFFAASAVAIGWFVHGQTQKNSQKRQHTVNLLNSSRMSETYQNKLQAYQVCYSPQSHISKSDVEKFVRYRAKSDLKERQELYKKDKEKIEAIHAAMYLLNFYEFACVGIAEGDLDNTYLYETVSAIVQNLYSSTKELVLEVRKQDPKYYEHLEIQLLNWHRKKDKEQREKLRH
ncbi:DUF4760 domain-containing protein [Pseudoalteromonas piscicida]|uniref:DUF4760 domain-containing protein n=1 Tax=Pseudoalteromonas piscicida TaxID=43662 RepID=UPI003C7DF036